jgi:glycosyltransferase involved in cell wall biosynthesis
MTPTISAICPTYARPHLLAEAVESFRRQDFKEPAELIVYNNFPGQILEIYASDFPGNLSLLVLNDPNPPESLGGIYNRAIAPASGKYLCPWEDDDIFLSHRISAAVAALRETGAEYHKRPFAWLFDYGKITGPVSNLFFCCGTWSADLFRRTGGIPETFAATDQWLEPELNKRANAAVYDKTNWREIFYLYRWGGLTAHLSGIADGARGFNETRERLRQGQPKGRVRIRPGWRQDYPALVAEWLRTHTEPTPGDK